MNIVYKLILDTVLKLLAYIEYGSRIQRVEASLWLAILFSPIAFLIDLTQKYVLTDRLFIEILFLLIGLDLVAGFIKHWKLRTFSFKLMFTGLMEKIFVSVIGMVLFNTIGSIPGLALHQDVLNYVLIVGKLVNAFYVGGSAFNSLYIVSGGKFPPLGWMKRMKSFNLTGNIEDLSKNASTDKVEPVNSDKV